MDQTTRRASLLDAHIAVREARDKFLRYAELCYRRFLNDPEQKPHAVACLGLNNWTGFRDRFGFRGLERLNRQIEQRLMDSLEPEDLGARFGDDSIVILLDRDRPGGNPDRWAREALKRLGESPMQLGTRAVRPTFSIGLCWFDRRVRGAEQALLDAMHLTELLARRNENRYRFFEPRAGQPAGAPSDDEVIELVRRSLGSNHVRLVFQPLLAAGSTDVQYCQVWARLINETGHEVRAREFLDAARQGGALARLNRWTLRRALQFLITDPDTAPGLRLFVNASIDTFEARTIAWLEQRLKAHRACRGCLICEFELFEFINRGAEAIRLIERLGNIGILIGLTGVGRDNLGRAVAHLETIDFLRMAPGFADELAEEPSLAARFTDLLTEAHRHEVRVVMPEMEREEELIEFWNLGVDLVQGDYIEHPRALSESAFSG